MAPHNHTPAKRIQQVFCMNGDKRIQIVVCDGVVHIVLTWPRHRQQWYLKHKHTNHATNPTN